MHSAASTNDHHPRAVVAGDAEAIVATALDALDALQPLVALETERLRDGKVTAALELADEKAVAARRYQLALEAIRANAVAIGRFRPPSLPLLRSRHEAFAGVLDLNMAVLATARTVSESLVRELAADVAQAQVPQGYGANGLAPSQGYRTPASPLAVSRSL
jgi:hypothetical protein